MYGIVYKVTNIVNKKIYVGQTTIRLDERKRQHFSRSKRSALPFHSALQKYNYENFTWEIVCKCSNQTELNIQEKYYADEFNSWVPHGYNLKAGDGKGSFSEISRMKMSESHIGLQKGNRHPLFGKHHSKETKAKISQSKKGKKQSIEHVEKKRQWRIGKELDKETKNKISEKVSKTYFLISPEGESIVITNMRKFCLVINPELNLSPSCICAVGQGRQKSHKGWTRDQLKQGEQYGI